MEFQAKQKPTTEVGVFVLPCHAVALAKAGPFSSFTRKTRGSNQNYLVQVSESRESFIKKPFVQSPVPAVVDAECATAESSDQIKSTSVT